MARVRNHRGKWQVLYRDPATKRERSAGVFSRKTDAQRKRKLIEREIEFGEWIDPDLQNTTYQEWIARWMPTRTDLKPKTVAGYESLLRSRIMPTFAGARLGWIRTIDVEEWVSAMDSEGLSPSRIHQAYHLFSSSLKAAVRSGFIRTNPAVGVRLPKMETTRDDVPQLVGSDVAGERGRRPGQGACARPRLLWTSRWRSDCTSALEHQHDAVGITSYGVGNRSGWKAGFWVHEDATGAHRCHTRCGAR